MVLIEIYTLDKCPACERAKSMLTEKNVAFSEILIGRDITREDVLAKFPGIRNAPIIVVDGKMVREVNEFKLLLEG